MCRYDKMSQCNAGTELRLFDEEKSKKEFELKLQGRDVIYSSFTC